MGTISQLARGQDRGHSAQRRAKAVGSPPRRWLVQSPALLR